MWWALGGIGGAIVLAWLLLGLFGERAEVRPAGASRAPREPVSLREAAARGIVPCSLDALRRASTRDPRFPAPLGHGPRSAALYRPVELVEWFAMRPGSPTRLQPSRSTVDHHLAVAQRQRGEDERAKRRNRRLLVDLVDR